MKDEWHQAVLDECMAVEACYKQIDPRGTIKALIDYHVQAIKPKPMTDSELYCAWDEAGCPVPLDIFKMLVRATECHHGILPPKGT